MFRPCHAFSQTAWAEQGILEKKKSVAEDAPGHCYGEWEHV